MPAEHNTRKFISNLYFGGIVMAEHHINLSGESLYYVNVCGTPIPAPAHLPTPDHLLFGGRPSHLPTVRCRVDGTTMTVDRYACGNLDLFDVHHNSSKYGCGRVRVDTNHEPNDFME